MEFLSFYILAFKLALIHLKEGNIHRGVYLLVRPIDYWRVFEFTISREYLDSQPRESILDISSPKLFPMHEAYHSGAQVFATDIYDDMGLTDTSVFKKSVRLDNLQIGTCDVRSLPFADASMDKAFSISVLEHVYPPEGGDVRAMKEITRVLKDDGIAVITLPFGKKHIVQYLNAGVYERQQERSDEMVFYQRRYDEESIRKLLEETSDFIVERTEYVCERFFHMKGKELCNIICEGNKLKRLSLAPFYWMFAFIFLTRTSSPLPRSDYMAICLKLRRKKRS